MHVAIDNVLVGGKEIHLLADLTTSTKKIILMWNLDGWCLPNNIFHMVSVGNGH